MFKEKVAVAISNKYDVAINMVLTITTHSQIPKKCGIQRERTFQEHEFSQLARRRKVSMFA
jgi:hypothetical protein